MSNYNEIDPLSDIVLLNHNDIVKTIDGTSKGINPIPSFDIAKGISAEVSAVKRDYFKLDANNEVSGDNTFDGNQTFKGGLLSSTTAYINDISIDNAFAQKASIVDLSAYNEEVDKISIVSASVNTESVKNSVIDDVEVKHSLSVSFDNVKNTKEEYLSSLHNVDQIKTINNIYRMVDEIEVEAGINPVGLDYSIDLENLVNIEIKARIIIGKQKELFDGSTIEEVSDADPLKIFYTTATADTDLETVVNALQEVLNRLKVAKYSLSDKIRSIEKSIDALENNLQDNIDDVEGKVDDALCSITRIDEDIAAMTADYSLSDGANVSIITSLKQTSGKVTIEAKKLISSDVGLLDKFANAMTDSLKQHAADNYLPLSGGKITGDLSIDESKSFYVGDSNKIVISGNTLCSILSNEITLSTSTVYNNLSSQLSNDFNFIYDDDKNVLCATVAGKIQIVPAAKFTEARMLDSVNVIYDAGKPFLELRFKTDVVDSYTVVSVDLAKLMPLYAGNDGIDIQYKDNKYQVSADETICRRSDISALDVGNSIEEGYILTSLAQVDGKIEYKQTKLLSSHVEGLTNYVKNAIDDSEQDIRAFTSTLSGNAGVISALCSTVNAKIQSLDFDDPGFYDDAGKVKVLTSLSQTDGKISASTKVLDYHKINGLSSAIDAKLDKTGGIIDGSLSVTKSILVNGAISLVNDPTNGGIAIGRNAQLSNEEAFVWSGAGHENIPYYSHGQHTFNINPDNGISGFYIGEENLASYINDAINDYNGLIDCLSNNIDKKIYIEDKISSEISGYSNLSVIKLSSSEYQDLVDSDKTSPSVLYVVESDFINAYGQQIKNLSAPELSSDAATKGYVDSSIVNVNNSISDVSSDLLEKMSEISGDLGEEISSKIYIEDHIGEDGQLVSSYSDLSIIKLSSNEYQDLVESNATLSNALYVVESDFINAYGQQIKNLANPNDLSDAATKGYVDDAINDKSNVYIRSVDALGSGELTTTYDKIDKFTIDKFSSSEAYDTYVRLSAIPSSDLVIVEKENLDAEGKRLINVARPTQENDAANKAYVDERFNAISSNSIISSVFNFISISGVAGITLDQSICVIYELVKILGYSKQ